MTVTPPRERAHRRTLRTRALASIGAVAIALLPLLGPVAAVAATPTPTPTPEPVIPAGTTSFTLSPVGGGIVRAGEQLAVSVSLRNATDVATAPVTVSLALGTSPLRNRAALTTWLAGDASGIATVDVGSAALDAVAPGAVEITGVGVAADSPVLQNLAPGVYPLVATYPGPDGPVSSTSAMIVPDDAAGEIGIGVVVPITAAGLSGGLLTADELALLTAPTGALSTQLDALEGTPAILAVDPAIPAAIRVLGSSAPASAAEWLERLETMPQSRFALQFGDADVAVQLEAGLRRPLGPLSLSAYMRPADFVPTVQPTPVPGSTPTADVDPDAPVYPDLASLLDIGGGRPGVFWPAAGTAGPATVATLGGITVDDQTSLTLVPSAATVQGASGATVGGRAQADEAGVLVYDTDVSRALDQASLIDENALRGAPLTAANAYLAFARTDTGGGPLLVALDRDLDRSRVGLRSAITTATQAPGVTPLTLPRLAVADSHQIAIADAAADPARAAAASALFAEETELSRFATILDDTSLITGPERAEILQLLGIGWLPDPATWSTAVNEHRAETAETLDSVGLLPTSSINLFGSGAELGFWVRNDLPYAVNLILYATSDDLRLKVQRATPLVAGASSNTRVEVPVQARVGSGEVTLDLQLRSRASVAIGDGATVDVTVRAEWESFGIIALSVVIGSLLVLGVVRTVLRMRARRRRRREPVPADSDAESMVAEPSDTDPERGE